MQLRSVLAADKVEASDEKKREQKGRWKDSRKRLIGKASNGSYRSRKKVASHGNETF
jgi:hypothetical protein